MKLVFLAETLQNVGAWEICKLEKDNKCFT